MVCKLIPNVLARGLWVSHQHCNEKIQNLVQTCLCRASSLCIAPTQLDHIAPWLTFISLSKNIFGSKQLGRDMGG